MSNFYSFIVKIFYVDVNLRKHRRKLIIKAPTSKLLLLEEKKKSNG